MIDNHPRHTQAQPSSLMVSAVLKKYFGPGTPTESPDSNQDTGTTQDDSSSIPQNGQTSTPCSGEGDVERPGPGGPDQ